MSKIVAILCRSLHDIPAECVANTDLIVTSFMSDCISGTLTHVWWLGRSNGRKGMLHVVNGNFHIWSGRKSANRIWVFLRIESDHEDIQCIERRRRFQPECLHQESSSQSVEMKSF